MSDRKLKYLEKILNSNEFANAEKYQRLLKYLVESSINGDVPKELTIAHEVFHVGIDEKEDLNIRVYIYNLRKKLDSYYLKEGFNDSIQFRIPKGRYKVDFVGKDLMSIKKQKTNILIASISGIIIIAAIISLFEIFPKKIQKQKKDWGETLWEGFINNGLPTLLVIGDYYLMQNIEDSSRVRFTRDIHVNSEQDFDSYIKNFPEKSTIYENTKLTMLGKFAPICVNDLSKHFFDIGIEYTVILGSEFQWKDLKNTNLVFVGSFKMMGYVKELFKDANFNYKIYPNELIFRQTEKDTIFHYYSHDSNLENAEEMDFSILTKLPNSNNAQLLFVFSTRDIGLIATTKLITVYEKLIGFENKHLNALQENNGFEACFEVKGFHRNALNIDLVNLNIIKNPTQVNPLNILE